MLELAKEVASLINACAAAFACRRIKFYKFSSTIEKKFYKFFISINMSTFIFFQNFFFLPNFPPLHISFHYQFWYVFILAVRIPCLAKTAATICICSEAKEYYYLLQITVKTTSNVLLLWQKVQPNTCLVIIVNYNESCIWSKINQ